MRTTQHPPENKPLLIWDGNCGLCKWWAHHFHYLLDSRIELETSQEARKRISDISDEEFNNYVFLLEPSGCTTKGAEAAYRAFYIFRQYRFLYKGYKKYNWFKKLSDWGYRKVANNRPFFFKVTRYLFGSNPRETRPFWAIYLIILCLGLLYRSV